MIELIDAGETLVFPFTPTNFTNVFGDASDGSVTLDGTTTFNGFSSLAGSTYTLTRDVFTTQLTINPGVTLQPAGFRIFSTGTVTNNGTITVAGGAPSGTNQATPGPISGVGTLGSGVLGAAGTTAAGTNGPGAGSKFGVGTPGAGGSGTSGAGGTGGGGQRATVWPHRDPYICLAGVTAWVGVSQVVTAGAGGGSGSGDGTNAGGAGGTSGGMCVIYAHSVINNGSILANGGNGGSPVTTSGGCGGGGAGAGGLILVYSIVPWTPGTTNVSAGAIGTGAGTGTNGTGSTTGSVLNVVLQ